MPIGPHFTEDAPQTLSEIVDDLAGRLHRMGYQTPMLGVFGHTAEEWSDCTHPFCLAVKMKALTTLADDEPEQPSLSAGVDMAHGPDAEHVLILLPNGRARGGPEALPLPDYLLSDSAPVARCSQCARESWDRDEVGRWCRTPMPHGGTLRQCGGVMRAVSP